MTIHSDNDEVMGNVVTAVLQLSAGVVVDNDICPGCFYPSLIMSLVAGAVARGELTERHHESLNANIDAIFAQISPETHASTTNAKKMH